MARTTARPAARAAAAAGRLARLPVPRLPLVLLLAVAVCNAAATVSLPPQLPAKDVCLPWELEDAAGAAFQTAVARACPTCPQSHSVRALPPAVVAGDRVPS